MQQRPGGGSGTPTGTPALPGSARRPLRRRQVPATLPAALGGRAGPGAHQGPGAHSERARGAGSGRAAREWPESRAPCLGPSGRARTRAPRAPRLPFRGCARRHRRRRPPGSNFAPGIEIPPQLRPSIRAPPRPSPRGLGGPCARAPPSPARSLPPRLPPRPSPAPSPRLACSPLPPSRTLSARPASAPPRSFPPRPPSAGGGAGGRYSKAQEGFLAAPPLPCPAAHIQAGAGERADAVARMSHRDPHHIRQRPGRAFSGRGSAVGPAHKGEDRDLGTENVWGRGEGSR